MRLKYLTLGIIILLCARSAHAATYTIDKRDYVSNWCTAPYNKIVAFFPPNPGRNHYYPSPTCTAQYVAKDIILTALHCVYYEGDPQTFQISNCKEPGKRWDAKIISKGPNTVDGDWALLRIQDPAGYSDDFFEVSPTTPESSDINNAGWGMIRRLSDEEITEIKNILKKYVANNSNSLSLDAMYEHVKQQINIDEPALSGKDNYPKQLKANTQCAITGTHDKEWCANPYSNPETCQQMQRYFDATCNTQHGNSGGPYFLNNTLYGIVSRGMTNAYKLTNYDMALKNSAFYDELLAARAASPIVETPAKTTEVTTVVTVEETSTNPVQNTPAEESDPPAETTVETVSEIPAQQPVMETPTETTEITTVVSVEETPANQVQIPPAEESNPPSETTVVTVPETPAEQPVAATPAPQTTVEAPVATVTVTEEEITASETAIINEIQNIDNASPTDVLNLVMKMADISQLRKEYEKAKAREQSIANKLLGAAAMGATGIGGMMALSGLAEQNADAAAERDMKAYLATFMCDYGQGRNITGGTTGVQLPNAPQLLGLSTEYKSVAAELTSMKAALNMQPGIESELVLNSAETGLYNNASIGKTTGAFTSLSRALMDKNSADAAAWAEQKQKSQSKTKTGAITAGTGAIGGTIGNLIINRDKGDEDKSDNKSQSDKNKNNKNDNSIVEQLTSGLQNIIK
ncbi:MAG: trypsin-like serine protease [Alphaproteobacteria bacterium]|nr:trypsin-like serine protease [Alphaproteobacteria bacterium]